MLYPKVEQNLLRQAFKGVLLMSAIQPAKVLSNALDGVLASGSDTRFVLAGNLAGTYAIGLPAAVAFGVLGPLDSLGSLPPRSLRKLKATCFFCGSILCAGTQLPLRKREGPPPPRTGNVYSLNSQSPRGAAQSG